LSKISLKFRKKGIEPVLKAPLAPKFGGKMSESPPVLPEL
jgi:hypothetical protein